MPELIEDRLEQREEVIERPVEHEPRRRRVEKHEEKQRHGIQLHLCFRQAALGEDDAGDEVDRRHEKRQDVDRHARHGEQAVGRAEVADGPEGHAVQQLQIREEGIGRDEKRDLQKQRRRALEHIGRLIVVLPVVGLQHHHALVAAECLFDVRHALVQAQLRLALFLLHGVGAPVERQHEEVHRKAQRDDGKTGVADDPVGHDEHHFKQQLERLDEQCAQNVPE